MNQNTEYTFGIASLEIIILLLLAFILGMLLCWLLRRMGLCCTDKTYDYEDSYNYDERNNTRSSGYTASGGGYTADMDSLLRSRDGSASSHNMQSRPLTSEIPRSDTHRVSSASAATTGLAASIAAIGGGRKDDLKKLEGIGPKIEQVLNAVGIQNYEQLAAMTPDAIKPILEAAGNQFKMHDPKSWPYQAELAAKGEWERLQEYQNLLIGGRE